MGFWTAWRFLTIFPSPKDAGIDQKGIGSSAAYFPLVGFILGSFLLGFDQLFDLFMPPILVSAWLVVALIIFTGALHLDGLMDTFDGFAVRKSAAERLKIMDDSHVGGFGVVAAGSLILLKYVSLISLPVELIPAALLLMPTLGRWSAAYALFAFPSAKREGLGQAYKEKMSLFTFASATLITLVIASAFMTYLGPAILAGIWLVTFSVARLFASRLGGLTGDTYGAMIEITEVCVLVSLAIIGEAGGTSWLGSYL
ncbi:MAG: adenosylcobinamide-GDP ribazoletransferase [Dehalococcoidia bacterium]|nr:adenosylcobinamide-GDP ribazoletransferase [Dehalococcoidia bacterium]